MTTLLRPPPLARGLGAAVFLVLVSACGAEPASRKLPTQSPAAKVAATTASASVPASVPASASASAPATNHLPRGWFEYGMRSEVGPKLGEATAVLLDGARALVHKNGSIEYEKASAPEALGGLFTVPTANGPRLGAYGTRGVYIFNDPLGPPTVLARGNPWVVGSAPSAVVVRDYGAIGPDVFIDIDTGAKLPITLGADTLGAGRFSLPLLPMSDVEFEDLARGMVQLEALGVFRTDDGGKTWQPTGRSWPTSPAGEAGEPLLLQWLRATRTSPARLAVLDAFDLPDHQALVQAEGKLARIDTTTFDVLEILDQDAIKKAAPCASASAGPAAWLGCAFKDQSFQWQLALFANQSQDPWEPKKVLRSPSGGAMMLVPCKPQKVLPPGEACVRSPAGAWVTIKIPKNAAAVGPLADGRIAYLKNPDPQPPTLPPEPDSCCDPPRALERAPEDPLQIVLRDAAGAEQVLPPLDFPRTIDPVALGGIEEDAEDGSLHLLIRTDMLTAGGASSEGGRVAFITQPKSGKGTVEYIPDAIHAALRGRHLIAAGNRHVRLKTIGGPFTEVPASEHILFMTGSSGTHVYATDTGFTIGGDGHIGWTHVDELGRPALSGGIKIGTTIDSVPGRPLLCTTSKGKGSPDAWGGIHDLVGMVHGMEALAPKTTVEALPSGALIFDYVDPWEESAAHHRVPLRVKHADAASSVVASGANALAVVGTFLVKVRKGRAPEISPAPADGRIAAVSTSDSPTIPSLFTTQKISEYDPITLHAWYTGEAPRPIYQLARVYKSSTLAFGEASAEGIPILLGQYDYVLWKLLPFVNKTDPPRTIPWTGWTRVDGARHPSTLPTCTDPPAPGAVTFVLGDRINAVVDGLKEHPPYDYPAAYKVRITGTAACVAGVLAPLTWDEPGNDEPKISGVNFIRADLIRNRAEGGPAEPNQALLPLSCSRP